MSGDRAEERRRRMAKLQNADGSVTPAADLPPELWTGDDQRNLEDDFYSVQAEIDAEADRLIRQAEEDERHPAAQIRQLIALADPSVPYTPGQELRIMTDVNNAVAHALSQPAVPNVPTPEQNERRIRESRKRMYELWGPGGRSAPVGLGQLLLETFGTPKAGQAWLEAPNVVLAGEAPAAYLRRGNEAAVRKLLRMAESGQPT